MQSSMDRRDVKELVRAAAGRLAPNELSRFDEVWQAYLDDPRSGRQILKSRDVTLGSGIDVIATAMTPLLASLTGDALVILIARQALGRGGSARRREARRTALTSPAPDPAAIERSVMRALLLDLARKSGCSEQSAAQMTDALVSVFTQQAGTDGADAAGITGGAAGITGGAAAGRPWRGKPRQQR